MADNLCPICHSNIDPSNPDWTADPILTSRGLAGEEYKGFTKLCIKHIKELQDDRIEQEIIFGIPEEERTEFSEIAPGETNINKKFINELRESTEKILARGREITETEREELLKTYFNYDVNGNYIGTYKYGQKVDDKKEWTDIDENDKPNFPKKIEGQQNIVKIKAIHIEDLRHPFFSLNFPLFLTNQWVGGYASGDVGITKHTVIEEDDILLLNLIKYGIHSPGDGINKSITVDNEFLYGVGVRYISGCSFGGFSWHRSCEMKKVQISDLVVSNQYLRPTPYIWTVDDNYIYSASYYYKSGYGWKLALLKLNKSQFGFISMNDLPENHYVSSGVINEDYLYTTSDSNFMGKFDKENLTFISQHNIEENTQEQVGTNPNGGPLYQWITYATEYVCMDDNYLYVTVKYLRRKQWIEWRGEDWYQWTEEETIYYIYILDKNFNFIKRHQMSHSYHNRSSFNPIDTNEGYRWDVCRYTVDNNYFYILGMDYTDLYGYNGHVYICNKNTFQVLNKIDYWDEGSRISRNGEIISSDEYKF